MDQREANAMFALKHLGRLECSVEVVDGHLRIERGASVAHMPLGLDSHYFAFTLASWIWDTDMVAELKGTVGEE